MRALIVLGGDAPDKMLLLSCAGYADLKIAADRGLEAYENAGITPDLLVGDMDSVDPDLLARVQGNMQVERLPVHKDDTDGVHALDTAIARGADQITILGALGGRMDHAMANLMLLVRAHRMGAYAEILDAHLRIVRIDEEITITGAKGDTFSLLPLGEAKGVTLEGCYYHSEEELSFDSGYPIGVSNVITEDDARIQVREGDLLFFHTYNA
ncbi:MAG: thiamine diphosphokinase [Clostridia bacterium]|nr:thiamine diphosphokinase [Clostridia bacterium]